MKKAVFKRNVNCTMSDEMFEKVLEITNRLEISFSQFIRESIDLKLKSMEINDNGRDKTL